MDHRIEGTGPEAQMTDPTAAQFRARIRNHRAVIVLLLVVIALLLFRSCSPDPTCASTADPKSGPETFRGDADTDPKNRGSNSAPGKQGTTKSSTPQRTTPTVRKLDVSVGGTSLLWPGVRRTVPVTVKNPHGFAIDLTRIEVTNRGSKACPPSAYVIEQSRALAGPRVLGKKSSTIRTPITLRHDAPASCQGSITRLHVTVTGERA